MEIQVAYLAGCGPYIYYYPRFRTFWTNDDYHNYSMSEYYDIECQQITGRYGEQTFVSNDFAYIKIADTI